jgi:hypothetical protein
MYIYYDYEWDDGGLRVGRVEADPAEAGYAAMDRLGASTAGWGTWYVDYGGRRYVARWRDLVDFGGAILDGRGDAAIGPWIDRLRRNGFAESD